MSFWKFFSQSTRYPNQQLSPEQLGVLEGFDCYLSMTSEGTDGAMSLRVAKVGLFDQIKGQFAMLSKLTDGGKLTGFNYIPRSVALIVDADGSWNFVWAARAEVGSDPTAVLLFCQALALTNNARTISR